MSRGAEWCKFSLLPCAHMSVVEVCDGACPSVNFLSVCLSVSDISPIKKRDVVSTSYERAKN